MWYIRLLRGAFLPLLLMLVFSVSSVQGARRDAPAASQRINLNTAGSDELQQLPGVGKATAEKIIAGRPYRSVHDLAKAGVPQATIEKIRGKVTVRQPYEGPAQKTQSASPQARDSGQGPGSSEVARTPPHSGMVWVNTGTGVFHKEGSRWYGKTNEGKFMTEADARSAGYRESKHE